VIRRDAILKARQNRLRKAGQDSESCAVCGRLREGSSWCRSLEIVLAQLDWTCDRWEPKEGKGVGSRG